MRFRMKPEVSGSIVGKHRMIIGGKLRVIKPGDVIDCDKSRLTGVLDKFEPLDPEPEAASVQPSVKLVAVKKPGGNFTGYDVINEATGKAINSKPLKKAEAYALVEEASADDSEADSSSDGDSGNDSTEGEDSSSSDEE